PLHRCGEGVRVFRIRVRGRGVAQSAPRRNSSFQQWELPMQQASAVLVIDMANDFVYPGGTIANAGGPEYQQRAQAVIPRLGKLLAAARAAGIQVIYATDAHTPKDKELRKWPPHSMAGSHEAEIVTELAPQPGDVVWGQ